MAGVVGSLGKATVVLGLIVFGVSIGMSTGAFSTADINRNSNIGIGEGDVALIGLDVTDDVSVACGERLVTITNNFEHEVEFTVYVSETRDGDLTLSPGGPTSDTLQFVLSPGKNKVVYITNVKGPISDDVEFDITAKGSSTDVSISRSVPKVPGNEDDDDEDDDNWGGDGCGDDESEDGDDDGDGDDGEDNDGNDGNDGNDDDENDSPGNGNDGNDGNDGNGNNDN